MLTARHAAIRLLKLMMVASLVLPAVLFAFATSVSYRNFERVSDERIDHSLDILHEHALKVLQAIERTGLFKGLYHVLGGAINPVDGVLPNNLKLAELKARLGRANGEAKQVEIILATNPTTYGETTALYIEEMLKPLGITTTRLARGLASGSYLGYIDATTLQNALQNPR